MNEQIDLRIPPHSSITLAVY
ncbi:hypothetical protein QQF64_034716, partial [Cirrhinus molitorella]